MDIKEATERLESLARQLGRQMVCTPQGYRTWRQYNADLVAEALDYKQGEGMPTATSLLSMVFNRQFELVKFNLNASADKALRKFPQGWTEPLRYCRGSVFCHYDGKLVSLPYPKFFGRNEHPETTTLPNEPFEATEQIDGCSAMIYRWRDQWLITSPGPFGGYAVGLGQKLVERANKARHWDKLQIDDLNLHVEIIHPGVRKICNYGRRARLVLTGAFDSKLMTELHYCDLKALAPLLGLDVTPLWEGESLSELEAHMSDQSIKNKKGFVAWFKSGLRVKFNYETYLRQKSASNNPFH